MINIKREQIYIHTNLRVEIKLRDQHSVNNSGVDKMKLKFTNSNG